MYNYTDLRTLHLEVTQRCNAACPQCSRFTSDGMLKPSIPGAELSLEEVKHILPSELVRQLTFIYLCGNHGDPMVGKDTLAILQYFREVNPSIRLHIHTNGGVRDIQWWQNLARSSCTCIFGIDGLEDTNHLYRIGTKWERVMENARAFIEAGGVAEWQFLVFRHNEHQVDEARQLSVQMGFRRFFIKSTPRFYSPKIGKEVPREVSRLNKPLGYTLEPASRPELRNAQVVRLESERLSAVEYDTYVKETEIQCKAIKRSGFYLSAEGFVLPCCWMGGSVYAGKTREESEVSRLISALPDGFASIDAKKHRVEDIVNGDFFQKIVPSSWARGTNRLAVCAKMCGSFDVLAGQYIAK